MTVAELRAVLATLPPEANDRQVVYFDTDKGCQDISGLWGEWVPDDPDAYPGNPVLLI